MDTIKVLTVDDNDDLRESIITALTHAGFTTLAARDGREGVALALEHHPDVILMDILMPDMNGHEAAEKIRQDKWGRDAKIIFLTSLSDAENVVKAVEKGSEDYLVKAHLSLEELVKKVRLVYHMQNS